MERNNVDTYNVRAVLLGDVGVGKTTLARYIAEGRFVPDVRASIAADFVTAVEIVSGQRVRLTLFDHTMSERFRAIPRVHLRRSQLIYVCFDITSRESFVGATQWLRDAHAHCGAASNIVLLGLKLDCADQRTVHRDEARDFVDEIGASGYEELSSEDGTNALSAIWEPIAAAIPLRLTQRPGSVRLPMSLSHHKQGSNTVFSQQGCSHQ
ncbi:MAG: Rab family GTPase [Flavobacteriaceae bacterium]|nr:Rab family GTPase [Flavobacteriaceae bacterium]